MLNKNVNCDEVTSLNGINQQNMHKRTNNSNLWITKINRKKKHFDSVHSMQL